MSDTSKPTDHKKEEGGPTPSFFGDIKAAVQSRCPKCQAKGAVFARATDLQPQEECPHCGFPLRKHDNGDGPAVFLIFVLGFLLVPLALWADYAFTIPLWVHGVLWTGLALILCVLSMRPLKTYIMILQYRHLPKTFDGDETQ